MKIPCPRSECYLPIPFTDPLYELSYILTKSDNTPEEQEENKLLAAPIMERSLAIIQQQLHAAQFSRGGSRTTSAEERYDYGFLRATSMYGLAVSRDCDGDVSSINTFEAKNDEILLVSGYLTGLVFGYDLVDDIKFNDRVTALSPYTGLWVCLSPAPSLQESDIQSECLLQLPQAQLLLPDCRQN